MQEQIQNEQARRVVGGVLGQKMKGRQVQEEAEEVIEEDITENYEQDFDSISNESRRQRQAEENQIGEDFEQIEEIIVECPQRSNEDGKQQKQKKEMEGLENDCKRMQLEIALLTQQIHQYTKADTPIEELQLSVSQNDQIIQQLQQQRIAYFQNKIGKDSFSLPLILTDKDFQQQLIREIDKLKQLISLSALQIGRIKRETKRYEQLLPMQQTNKEQFYQRYKKLKKEVEDKREKCDAKQIKENQLDEKVAKLKEKLTQIDVVPVNGDETRRAELQRSLYCRYQDLVKKKEAENKKNNLLAHQLQANYQISVKNIQELRKQSAQLQQRIEVLDKKNTNLQQESCVMMQKYQQNRVTRLSKERSDNDSSNTNHSPSDFKIISQTQNRRKKYYSETKNPFTTNMLNPNMLDQSQSIALKDRYIIKLRQQKSTPSHTETKEEINQSFTSNTLKQFQLRLPNSTPKKSVKNLNVSLDIAKGTPTKPKTRTDLSKLSITQRLQRIELLEKEDRIYSHKLYDIKKKEEETIRKQTVSAFAQSKEFNSADQLQLYQKQLAKNVKESDVNLSFTSDPQTNLSLLAAPQTSLPPEPDPMQQSSISIPQLTDRLPHKYFKKRIIHRQKKISQQYMRVLEQRGRKILELDNESEC